jgi:FtsH-binding integral membrane protein
MDRGEETPADTQAGVPTWRARAVIALLTAAVSVMPAYSFVEAGSEGPNAMVPYIAAALVAVATAVLVLRQPVAGFVVSAAVGAAGVPVHGLFAGVSLLAWLWGEGEHPAEAAVVFSLLCVTALGLLSASVANMPRQQRIPHALLAVGAAVVFLGLWLYQAGEL